MLTVGLWIYVIIIGLLLFFAVLSNALVIYCVVTRKKLRSVTNVFICNLSVSDILLAGFVMPQRLHDISHTDAFYEGVFLCKLVNFFPIFVITSSIYTLVCISFERERAIKESQKQQITYKSLYIIIPILWTASLVVSLPTLIEYSVNNVSITTDNVTEHQLSCGSQHRSLAYTLTNSFFVVAVSYLLPVVIMCNNYIKLAYYVWQKGRQVNSVATRSNGLVNSQIFKRRIQTVKLLVLVAVIFSLSWLPFFVMLLYAKVTQRDASGDASGFVNLLLLALAAFSTAYNVVLYVVYNPSFSKAIKEVLRCDSPSKSFNGHSNSAHSVPAKQETTKTANEMLPVSTVFSENCVHHINGNSIQASSREIS